MARSFRQAQPYITIEDRVIDDALQWLSANQAVNGSFPEVGKVSHTDMQGGAGKGVPLTAYVLLAFLENKVCALSSLSFFGHSTSTISIISTGWTSVRTNDAKGR